MKLRPSMIDSTVVRDERTRSGAIVLMATTIDTRGTRKAIFQNRVEGLMLQKAIPKSHSPKSSGTVTIVISYLGGMVFMYSINKVAWTHAAAK